ncbi:MAG: sulfurtransferase-like selenium metabolism protein YedF, partial [Clostridia bacterium]|nr:sulfurtransferase-like selenium metabolism protein YedF [Clostridia bacterium]
LGQVLMRSFFYTLREAEVVPGSIIFINSGVKLACEGSPVLSDLMALEKRGVRILSCGTCLDYFQLKEKLCVGSISNMYSIVEAMMTSDRLITLG